jgi:hypothetical protein
LPVVLYGCETWSLTLREERRLRVFENRVLRRIFGPKRDEVIGGWRKLRNEELHNLYCSPSIIRMIKSRRMRIIIIMIITITTKIYTQDTMTQKNTLRNNNNQEFYLLGYNAM